MEFTIVNLETSRRYKQLLVDRTGWSRLAVTPGAPVPSPTPQGEPEIQPPMQPVPQPIPQVDPPSRPSQPGEPMPSPIGDPPGTGNPATDPNVIIGRSYASGQPGQLAFDAQGAQR